MRLLLASLLLLFLSPLVARAQALLGSRNSQQEGALGSELYANSGVTGMVVVIVRGDKVFIHGYGETAPGSHVAPSDDSVIRLCSLTKIFTTDVLAKLVADGTVRLDDPLQKYAPQGVRVPQRGAPITLLDLATHTAGLDREIGSAPRRTPHFTYPDFATRWQWLPTAELKFTPGTQAFYSNVGFDLLSDALADASRTPYSTLLWMRTLKPLEMWETTFYPTAAQCARLMQGAHQEGPCTVTENTEGSSGLYSTPEDMAKWLRYLVSSEAPNLPAKTGGAFAVYLVPSTLRSISGLSHAGRPSGIGLGWMHLDANDEASHIIEKTGGGAGFTTYIAIHPASHSAIFVAATDGSPRAGTPGFRLFQASTNGLLALAGLPPRPNVLRRQVLLTRVATKRISRGKIVHAAAHRSSGRMSTSNRMRRPVKHAATAAEVSSK